MAITLPKTPDGNQFEDYVAASLRALGYFVETRVTLRDGKKEVLELDVVATPSGGTAKDRELYEAKKNPPSFPDLFKLYGQRMYLGIDRACLATHEDADALTKPVYEAKGAELNVRPQCHTLDVAQLTNLAPAHNTLAVDKRGIVAWVAWFLQIAKRTAQSAHAQAIKANVKTPPYEQLKQYVFETNASFFGKTPLDRAEALYAAYFDNPKLSGQLVDASATIAKVKAVDVWNQVNDTHEKLWIQAQMLLEGTSRIAIIKHALDHVVQSGGAPLPTLTLRIGSKAFEIQKHAVPGRFVEGLKTLHEHPHSLRLPYLYQTFLNSVADLCS